MIIVMRDPANISGAERYVTTSQSWRKQLFKIFPDGLDASSWRITLNGNEIKHDEFDLDALPCFADVLVLQHRPRGLDPFTWALIGIAAAAAVASYLLMPKPNLNGMGSSKTSPNNSFSAQTNIVRAYQAWPDIFGRIRAYPDIIVPAVQQYVDNLKQLEHTFWIGRGSFDITQMRYGDTPLSDYANSTYSVYGDGVAIPSVTEQFAAPEVDGQELLGINEGTSTGDTASGLPLSGSFVYVSPSSGTASFDVAQTAQFDQIKANFDAGMVDAMISFSTFFTPPSSGELYRDYSGYGEIVSMVLSGGVYSVVFSTGFLPGYYQGESIDTGKTLFIEISMSTTIGPFTLPTTATQLWYDIVFLRGLKGTASFMAEWWAIDGSGNEISGSRQNEIFSYSDNTSDQKYFTRKVTPSYGLGKYRFQIKRTNNADIANGTNQAKLEGLFAMRFKSNVVYSINGIGGTAIRINSSATEQATSGSELKFNCMAQRKVITVNSDGTINTTLSASRRVVDSIAHHMHIDAGVALSQIDLAGLYAIQQSISDAELGYFDGSFDDADISLGDRIKTMCNVARVMVNREGSSWVFNRDEAKPYPVVTFDRRTLASADYTLTKSPSSQKGYDGVEVEWYDITGTNTKKYVRVKWNNATNLPVLGYGSRMMKLELTGCSSYAQALDRAELEMRKIIYQRDSVSDTALSDANLVWRGDRVRWVDVADVAVSNGEILAVNGTTYTTSDDVIVDNSGAYKVAVTDAEGYASAFVTCTARTDGRRGFLASGLPTCVIANGMDIQLGSRYIVVKATEVGMHDFILSNKTPANDGTIGIELVQYDDRIYQRTLTA